MCMYVCIYVCLSVCLSVWLSACMYVSMYLSIYLCMYVLRDVCMYGWMDGWMAGWLHGCMDVWMHACMHGWIDGWMDGCAYTCVYIYNVCEQMCQIKVRRPKGITCFKVYASCFHHQQWPVHHRPCACGSSPESLRSPNDWDDWEPFFSQVELLRKRMEKMMGKR